MAKINPKVFRPNIDEKRKNEVMEYDSSAYLTLNQLKTDQPSMSFDIIKNLGESPKLNKNTAECQYPLNITFVAGSQAPENEKKQSFSY